MRKTVLYAIAGICIFFGLLTVWTPIPTGVPLLAAGLFILVGISPRMRRVVKSVRGRSPLADHSIAFIEDRAHRKVATTLKRTRPAGRISAARAKRQALAAQALNVEAPSPPPH